MEALNELTVLDAAGTAIQSSFGPMGLRFWCSCGIWLTVLS